MMTIKVIKVTKKITIQMKEKDYFETDGTFCSFNCCLAFINDNIKNPMYYHSRHLMNKMYETIFRKEPIISPVAIFGR